MEVVNEDSIKLRYDNRKISIALMAPFVILMIQFFIIAIFELSGTVVLPYIQQISKLLVGLIFLFALPLVLKRNLKAVLLVYLISILIFATHFLLFPQNQEYIKEIVFSFFFICLPAFIYSLSIDNISVLKQVMKKAGLIVFILGSILGILIITGVVSIGLYSMALSYYMLLPLLIHLDELIEKFSFKSLIISAISIMIILLFGARGAVLCAIIFFGLKLIRLDLKASRIKVFNKMIILFVVITTYLFMDEIFLLIKNFFLNVGIKSRSLDKFLSGEVTLSGRENIYQNLIEAISLNPILGIGIAGDRVVIGNYAHNIIIEILANFGIIIGGIGIILLFTFIIISLLTSNTSKYNMIAIWICLGFIGLMVSHSYLTEFKFWIFFGLMMNFITKSSKGVVIQ